MTPFPQDPGPDPGPGPGPGGGNGGSGGGNGGSGGGNQTQHQQTAPPRIDWEKILRDRANTPSPRPEAKPTIASKIQTLINDVQNSINIFLGIPTNDQIYQPQQANKSQTPQGAGGTPTPDLYNLPNGNVYIDGVLYKWDAERQTWVPIASDNGQQTQETAGKWDTNSDEPNASNRALYQRLLQSLRAQMAKPFVQDADLARLMDQLYRPGARFGSGSTAAMVRIEGALQVDGDHATKARNYIDALEKWLQNRPTATPGDRAAAENVILDMRNALEGK